MLSPMVDAPIFVRIARENNLCAFVAGPSHEEAKMDHEQFKGLSALWSVLEPYVQAYGYLILSLLFCPLVHLIRTLLVRKIRILQA